MFRGWRSLCDYDEVRGEWTMPEALEHYLARNERAKDAVKACQARTVQRGQKRPRAAVEDKEEAKRPRGRPRKGKK